MKKETEAWGIWSEGTEDIVRANFSHIRDEEFFLMFPSKKSARNVLKGIKSEKHFVTKFKITRKLSLK